MAVTILSVVVRDRLTGKIKIGPGDRITRQLGSITVSGNGSLNVPEFAQGKPWIIPQEINPANISNTMPSFAYVQGNTIQWRLQPTAYPNRATRVIYGVA